jgi:hypothetical protein
MISRLLIFAAWIGLVISTFAAPTKMDSLTVGSMTYRNVTVIGVNASDLYFNSNHGIRNVKLRLLSPELQREFHYDEVAASQAEAQQAEDEKRYHENLAAQMKADYDTARDAQEAKSQALYAEAGLADAATTDSPIGKTAPDLDVQVWVGTKPVMEGKLTIVNIWSPKSASCRKWIPALNSLSRNNPGKVAVIGVTPAPPADVMQTNPKVEFPCAIDSDGKFITGVGVTTFPCIMLLDSKRVIRFQGHPAALTPEILENILGKVTETSAE